MKKLGLAFLMAILAIGVVFADTEVRSGFMVVMETPLPLVGVCKQVIYLLPRQDCSGVYFLIWVWDTDTVYPIIHIL